MLHQWKAHALYSCPTTPFSQFSEFLVDILASQTLKNLLPSVTPPTSNAISFFDIRRRFINATSMESTHILQCPNNAFSQF